MGAGGIAIVRISGPDARKTMEILFNPINTKLTPKTHRLYLGNLHHPQNRNIIDQVLCCFMKGPRSYTREDMVEFHCHGGDMAARRVLEAVLSLGISMAEPGEFTKKAFLSGRIDLTQAEAVIDLINARSLAQADLATAQLTGGLKNRIEEIRKILMDILAVIEAGIDFPDDDEEELGQVENIRERGYSALKCMEELLEDYDSGKIYRQGIRVVIAGRPNVGKSSLLNSLLKNDRAIVTALPGTTRDVIEGEAAFEGLPVTLIDTAGLREKPGDEVEREGQNRAGKEIDRADLVLFVLDVSGIIDREDQNIYEAIKHREHLIVLNKNDLPRAVGNMEIKSRFPDEATLAVSALRGTGLESLKKMIVGKFIKVGGKEKGGQDKALEVAPNLRHKKALEIARDNLNRAVNGLGSGLALELVAVDIGEALREIGKICGVVTSEEILDQVFERFCLGK